ncbi:Zn(II)2Cys6 transcription factor domain-containing protein [Aspergillus mulundensis]|uniref:Zn(2)-C6 fungal-type domain-containing protein n=1 Tax=Aspergillus mulundensis TaxID=1810919 RepID=A0A3D8T2I0_9EURO|nr:hypothetical protein DSM5745_00062 [Aspergillus mulundensis]RDW92740.1 hypothetical protein DSM5745_00062 [Aspergillus mulundensis]
MDGATSPRRRSFKIKTKFGAARQWRSRKNRPCDACRRRKTACIIETVPPCRFCRSKGQVCKSTDGEPSSRHSSGEIVDSDDATDSTVVDASYTSIQSLLSPEIEPSPLAGGLPASPSARFLEMLSADDYPAPTPGDPAPEYSS